MRTSGTVIMWPSITGSCTSPRDSISATAWRISSPTRSWRWDAVAGPESCFGFLFRGMTISNVVVPRQPDASIVTAIAG